jgi:hypothetical protein
MRRVALIGRWYNLSRIPTAQRSARRDPGARGLTAAVNAHDNLRQAIARAFIVRKPRQRRMIHRRNGAADGRTGTAESWVRRARQSHPPPPMQRGRCKRDSVSREPRQQLRIEQRAVKEQPHDLFYACFSAANRSLSV